MALFDPKIESYTPYSRPMDVVEFKPFKTGLIVVTQPPMDAESFAAFYALYQNSENNSHKVELHKEGLTIYCATSLRSQVRDQIRALVQDVDGSISHRKEVQAKTDARDKEREEQNEKGTP